MACRRPVQRSKRARIEQRELDVRDLTLRLLHPETVSAALSAAAAAAALPPFKSKSIHLLRCCTAVNPSTRASEVCDAIVSVWSPPVMSTQLTVPDFFLHPDTAKHVYAWWWSSSRRACSIHLRPCSIDVPATVMRTLPIRIHAFHSESSRIGLVQRFLLQPCTWNSLTSLCLVDVGDVDDLLTTFSQRLALCRSLRRFQLRGSRPPDTSQLVQFLRLCPGLQELNLEALLLEDFAATALAELLQTKRRFQRPGDDGDSTANEAAGTESSGSERDSSETDSSDESDGDHCQNVRYSDDRRTAALPQLQSLVLSYNSIQSLGAAALLLAARYHPALQRLDLSHNDFMLDDELHRIAKGLVGSDATELLPNSAPSGASAELRHIILANTSSRQWGSVAPLVAVFRLLGFPQLQSLDLNGRKFLQRDLSELFFVTPLLSSLCLASGWLGSSDARALVNTIANSPACEHMTSLNLSGNRIDDSVDDAAAFLRSLTMLPRLEVLHLGRNYLTEKSTAALVAAALSLPRLKHWHLEGFAFSNQAARVAFVNELAVHTSLEVLCLDLGDGCREQTTSAKLFSVPFVVCSGA